jgi:hypothetical protein
MFHTANQTCDFLWRYGWEVMDRHPYSPDLVPRNLHLLEPFSEQLTGKQFATEANIQQAVNSWLEKILDTDFFYARIQALDPQ